MSTVTRERVCLIVTIAGLGINDARVIQPIPIATAGTQLQPSPSVFELPYRALIARDGGMPIIDVANSGVSPVRGDPQQGTLDFEMIVPDAAGTDIARYFAASSARPACYALTPMGPTDITIGVDPAELAASGIDRDSIIYWNREAFVVDAVDLGLGVIQVVDTIPSGTRTANGAVGVLGHLGTYIEQHLGEVASQKPPYNDSRIYTTNPFVKDREVCVWQTNGETIEQVHSRYYLESVTWTNNQTSLSISARDVLAVLSDQQVNFSVTTYAMPDGDAGFARNGITPHPSTTTSYAVSVTGENIDSSLILNSATKGGLIAYGEVVAWVAASGWSVDAITNYGSGYLFLGRSERLTALNGGATADAASSSSPFYEVLATNPDFYSLNEDGDSSSPYFSATLGTEAVHPLDILRCHLGTLDSNLPQTWLSKLPPDHINDDEIVLLRDTVYAGWTWRGIVHICDGSATGMLEFLTSKILRPIGASFTVDASGRVTVRSLFNTADTSLPLVGDNAILIGRGVAFDLEIGVDAIRAETGVLASGDRVVQVFGTGAYRSSFGLTRQSQIIDLEADGLISIADFRSVDQPSIQRYAERLARIAALFRLRSQTVTLQVMMTAGCEPGQYRRMMIRGLREPETGLVSATPSERVGYITAVENDPRTNVAKIVAVLYPVPAKRIGPSATVSVKVSDEEFEVSPDVWVPPLDGSGAYLYAPSTNASVRFDWETFAIDDEIIVRDAALAALTQSATITGISGPTIYTTPLTALGGGSYTPQVGDIVTLADWESWKTEPVYYAFFDRDTFGL